MLSVFTWSDPLNRPGVLPGEICGHYRKGDFAFVINLMISGGLTTVDVCDHLKRSGIEAKGVFAVIELLQKGKKSARELLAEFNLPFRSFIEIDVNEIQRVLAQASIQNSLNDPRRKK